jgi:putative Holliday junction resolvase
MGRILGIDYGKKRVGLAVTDPLKIISNSLDTIDTSLIINYLKQYLQKEEVEAFVLGLPVDLQNNDTDVTADVRRFAKVLEKEFPAIKLHFYDERFTSKMAMQTLVNAGKNKKFRRDKSNIDKVSASIILRDWMEYSLVKF